MKRLLLFLSLATWILSPVFILYAAQEEGGVEATIVQRAKLRDGPGTDWYILGYVEAGTVMRLDARAPFVDALWVRGITADGRVGWVFGDLIEAPADQLAALPTKWADDPFLLTAPQPAATPPAEISAAEVPIDEAAETPAPQPAVSSSGVVSGISDTARTIFERGQQLGNRANVFSKVGDSITYSRYFLFPIGWGTYNLHGYSGLQDVINFFSSESARDGNNSFANSSLAAYNGLTTQGLLDPSVAWPAVCQQGETPLECEYRLVKPSVALIMIGTNDLVGVPEATYRSNLERIVQISIDRGVIPVLSLLPVRAGQEDRVPGFNAIIESVASNYGVPLWNYAGAMAGLYQQGINDGIHPSYPPGSSENDYAAAADFNGENLKYGYTVRNLTALQVLDAIWRQVID